ncbi:MAG: S8 family serine peptidase [Bdellovibrio sp.]|nr:S8 family serine peptidase [Bdellovibrio sp.]
MNTSFFALILILFFLSACNNDDASQKGMLGEIGRAINKSITDPLFLDQWHLSNTGQMGGNYGEDINVSPVWAAGNKGDNVIIAVVDDGFQIGHPDLSANVTSGSYNYLSGTSDPSGPDAIHGTCVAGVIAARDMNGVGVSGVAPRAKLMGFNLLEDFTDANTADAMIRNYFSVAVSNNSWGPNDGLGGFDDSPSVWRAAVETGLADGNGGKGTVYVWAGGNGAFSATGQLADWSNYDGYANFHGVIAVCAVGEDGVAASYSEPGANLWVCAPSQGSSTGPAITTTDISGSLYGFNTSADVTDLSNKDYTKYFNGTSASAPMVAGVAALILKANPLLTWRDVKIILAASARKNDPSNAGWTTNAASPPYNISYDYGFGVVDAEAAVLMASSWSNVGTLVSFAYPVGGAQVVNQAVPDNGTVVSSSVVVAGSGITKIEFVEVTVNMTHQDWGNLAIQLERSGGISTISRLTNNHKCFSDDTSAQVEANCTIAANTFRFGTARHLGEPADGTWTLKVQDADSSDGKTGTLTSWRLNFYGE